SEKPFTYDVRVTMADYRATVTKFNNTEKRLDDYYAGQRIGEIWGYRVEGLFRSEEEIANSPSQANVPSTNTRKTYVGDVKFKSVDGDDMIYQGENRAVTPGDKTLSGHSEPRYLYGLNLTGDWNGFFVSVFFQGVLKQDYY